MVIGEFLDDERLGQPPADEDAEDDAAEGHDPQGGDVVEGVEEATTEEGTEVCKGAEAERTQRGQHGSGERHVGGGTTAAGAIAVDEEGGDLLVHGDGAGEGRQHEQHIEHQREDVAHSGHAAEQGVEDVGQRDEDEARAGIGRDARHGEDGGEDDETGEDGDGGVDAHDVGSGLHQWHIGLEVAGVGGEAADGDGKREERLPEGGEDHRGIYLREVGFQQELHADGSTGHGQRTYGQQNHQNQQQGHHDLGETLDAVLHTTLDDDVGEEQEGEGKEQGRPRGAAEGGEVGSRVADSGKAAGSGRAGILQHPAGNDAVVGEDEGDAEHASIAGEVPRLARCQPLVRRSNVRMRSASDDELGSHHGHSEEDDAEEVDEDEGSAAMLTRLDRKTPDVAQPHGGACRGKDDAQAGGEGAAIRGFQVHSGRLVRWRWEPASGG